MVDPIHDYPRTVGTTVTGGYVYRGGEHPELDGAYFFADFGNGKIWTLRHNGTTMTELTEWTGQIPTDVGSIGLISSFGEDALGRLYVVDLGGEVFRLTPVPEPSAALLIAAAAAAGLLRRRRRRRLPSCASGHTRRQQRKRANPFRFALFALTRNGSGGHAPRRRRRSRPSAPMPSTPSVAGSGTLASASL